jgi:choline dehydrogenase-like flavoprotein
MRSGIGDQAELQRLGIPVVQHLPGVGQNFQDHLAFGCIWEYREALPPRNSLGEATFFWKSAPREIEWTTKLYGDAFRRMELPEEESDVEEVGHVVKRYVPVGVVCAISPWNLPAFCPL